MNFHQILYINLTDDLQSTKQKMKESKREKIILVLPGENKNLKNIESLTSLKKEAQMLGKILTIFSSDSYYRKLAEECGIEIEKSLIEDSFFKKEEVSFRPKIRDILPKREIEEKPIPKKVEPEKPEEEILRKKPKIAPPLLYILFFVLLVGGGFFGFYYLPKAEILIVPAGEEIEFSGGFLVKKGGVFDLKASLVPGELIKKEKEVEKSFLATGSEKRVDKAKGEIVVYNEDSRPHNFLPHTRFQSPDGKIFKQPEGSDWISIPGGSKESPGKVKIKVVAEEAGEEYNIEPTKFTLPGLKGTDLYKKIYGKSTEKMEGGFIGEAKVLTKEDIEKARKEMERLEENLTSELEEEVLKELPLNLQFLRESIFVLKEGITFDKKVGTIGETFKGRAKVTEAVLKFEEKDIQRIIAAILKDKIKEEVEFEEVVSSLKVEYEVLESKIQGCIKEMPEEECQMEVKFKGKEKVAWKIEGEGIKMAILGKDPMEFEKYIREDMKGKIEKAELILWPFWVNKIPQRRDRIFIQVKYE